MLIPVTSVLGKTLTPDKASIHPGLILTLAKPWGPHPVLPFPCCIHLLLLNFTPTVAPESCFPSRSNADMTIQQVHLLKSWIHLLRWLQKVIRLWVGVKSRRNSQIWSNGEWQFEQPPGELMDLQVWRLWQKSLIKITVKLLQSLPCTSCSQSGPTASELCTAVDTQDSTSLPEGWLLDIIYNWGSRMNKSGCSQEFCSGLV